MNARELRDVAVALRTTTERLASELARPTPQPPDWSPLEWRIARATASLHGISALLARTLAWSAPDDWRRFLAEQADHTARRQVRIDMLLETLDGAARRHGIPFVALKGAAVRALAVYAPGTRPMADLDLLSRDGDAPQLRAIVESLGYRERYVTARHVVLEPADCPPPAPFGEHEANGITIELHTRVAESLPLNEVELTPQLWPRDPQPGLNPYASRAALLAHVLLHAAGAMVGQSVRLLHLQDVARLARRLDTADWAMLEGFGERRRGLWWAWPPLAFAARYYGGIPASVLRSAAAHCPLLLRRRCTRAPLADFSLSQPWIEAFPGLVWSDSAAEMARYGFRRLIPRRAHLRARVDAARTEAIFSGSAWAGLSQARRILRFAGARQARVATMYVVQRALAHPT